MNFHNRVVRDTFAALVGDSKSEEVLDTRLESLSPEEACKIWDSFVAALVRRGHNVRFGKLKNSANGNLESGTFVDGGSPVQIYLKEASGEDGPEFRLVLKSGNDDAHELAASALLEEQNDMVDWIESLTDPTESGSDQVERERKSGSAEPVDRIHGEGPHQASRGH